MSKHPVYIIQGAQWGSEGKGQIAAIYAKHASAAVRTGSINAGHTVWYKGKSYTMQLIPTAWVQPGVSLVLGPGCYISPETLEREIQMIGEATGKDVRDRLVIDRLCTLHTEEHGQQAKSSGRHHEIGSTAKGSSNAVVDRILARSDVRKAQALLFSRSSYIHELGLKDCIIDTTRYLHEALDMGHVVIEGTQGAHLDVLTGPYPYTTNRPVSTSAWLAYCGLPPTLDIRPVLVARTFPIRVAGNSGPMPGETTWSNLYLQMRHRALNNGSQMPKISLATITMYDLALERLLREGNGPEDRRIDDWTDWERYHHRALLSEAPTQALLSLPPDQQAEILQFFEKTTVTKKIRRVARFNIPMINQAIRWNGCHEMWITFLNYKFPELWGKDAVHDEALEWLNHIQCQTGAKIKGVSTERFPDNHIILNHNI